MAVLDLRTPGVYIQELDAFTNSIVPVPTAVPAFIGYTGMAVGPDKEDLTNTAFKISSMNEFHLYFGGPPSPKYKFTAGPPAIFEADTSTETYYFMYYAMLLFYANGGNDCYIVSVGGYGASGTPAPITAEDVKPGIDALNKATEPTMVVVPDAVSPSCVAAQAQGIMQHMLLHCGTKKSRVSIFDIYDGYLKDTPAKSVTTDFQNAIGTNFLEYGAVYYPWLHTSTLSLSDISFNNITQGSFADFFAEITDFDTTKLDTYLAYQAPLAGADVTNTSDDKDITTFAILTDGTKTPSDGLVQTVNNMLANSSPIYKSLMNMLLKQINLLPPSGAMAGLYTLVDNNFGVWKAPANVAVSNVTEPSIKISHNDQKELNVPLTGKAINAIRTFPGKGVLVWGARTLDGNSQDWRYISVRRTIIFIEESVKIAAQAFVFEANDAQTWGNLKSMISQFLTSVWAQGGLAGAKASDAFSVAVGLGVTMTAEDILNGHLNITVKVAVTHPAEFIVITVQQQLQKS